MLKFLFGFLIGLFLIPILIWCYFAFGYAPVATAAPPMLFEKRLARLALHARIEAEAPKKAPIPGNEENYLAGAQVYRTHCAVCHGLPGQPSTLIAKGMFPKPPQLFRGHGVTDDPVGETYWKVANGIRMTGMPAYTNALSDTEMWQVSLLLADADKVSPNVRNVLQQPLTVH